jgi:hypothetical protein
MVMFARGGASGQRILKKLFLRETKLQKPHLNCHRERGAAYDAIAASLNECGRLPWETDKNHAQGQHLATARRAHQRQSARSTAVEEYHGEVELVHDLIDEAAEFNGSEADRRDTTRAREANLEEVGRRARDMAMQHLAKPVRDELVTENETSAQGAAGEAGELGYGSEARDDREHATPTPSAEERPSFGNRDSIESEVLRLMQVSASSSNSESKRRSELEAQRLAFDIERDKRQHDLDQEKFGAQARCAKTEEDREARFQRKKERDDRLEELRIAVQQVQTSIMLKKI